MAKKTNLYVVLGVLGAVFFAVLGFLVNDMLIGDDEVVVSEYVVPEEGEEEVSDEIGGDEESEEEEGESSEEAESSEEVEEVEESEVSAAVPATADDPNVDCIKDYYSHFWVDELDEAFEMKYHPKISFDTFVGWYENTLWANPYEFMKIGDNEYEFMVDLMEEGGNNERYRVVMKVHGGRHGLVETISSTKVNEELTEVELVYDSKLKAYMKWVDGDEQIYLVKNGVKKLIDSIDRPDYTESFTSMGDFEFSDSGRYLTYYKHGWEGGLLKIYDVLLEKSAFQSFTPYEYGFTKDEKYFYECQGTGMHGGFLNIWSLPDFKLKRDLYGSAFANSDYGVDTCEYDPVGDVLEFTLWKFGADHIVNYYYKFNDDTYSEML